MSLGRGRPYVGLSLRNKTADFVELYRTLYRLAIKIHRSVDAASMFDQYVQRTRDKQLIALAAIDYGVACICWSLPVDALVAWKHARSYAKQFPGWDAEIAALDLICASARTPQLKHGKVISCIEAFGGFDKVPLWFAAHVGAFASHPALEATDALSLLKTASSRAGELGLTFATSALITYTQFVRLGYAMSVVVADVMVNVVAPDDIKSCFAQSMPIFARLGDTWRLAVVEAYRRLRDRKVLPADFLPYSAAFAVLEAQNRSLALMALHPEVREAVSMLLDPVDAKASDAAGKSEIAPASASAVSSSTSPPLARTRAPSGLSPAPAARRRAGAAGRSPGKGPARSPRR